VEECPKEVEVPRPGTCEGPPDLLASLLQQLGGEAAFGEVVQEEMAFNQLDDPHLLTPSSNCDLLLDLVDGDAMQLKGPSNEISLVSQHTSESSFPSMPLHKDIDAPLNFDLKPEVMESLSSRAFQVKLPTLSEEPKSANNKIKCQCSMHMLVGYPPSPVVPWKVLLSQGTPIFASPALCLLYLRNYLKCLEAPIQEKVEEEVNVLLCGSCVAWADKQVESDLSVVEEATKSGVLVEQVLGGVVSEMEGDHLGQELSEQGVVPEIEGDHLGQEQLHELCKEIIMDAFSCGLEKKCAAFQMCQDILLEDLTQSLCSRPEVIHLEISKGCRDGFEEDVTLRSDLGLERKLKWDRQPEAAKEPLSKRSRRSEFVVGDEVKKCEDRRRSLRQRTPKNLGRGNGQVARKDVNQNTDLGSRECRKVSPQTLRPSLHIECPACKSRTRDFAQFKDHVESKHKTRVGLLRNATKCCCSLHSYICQAYAGSHNNNNRKRLTRGVVGMTRPDNPEERSARTTLSRHQLLLNMKHNFLCTLCIKFVNTQLIATEEGDKVELEVCSTEVSSVNHKKKWNGSDHSRELGKALEVQVNRLTNNELASWGAKTNGRAWKYHECEVSGVEGPSEFDEGFIGKCEVLETKESGGGERLKQLLMMEVNLRQLLGQGDLALEERQALSRLRRLVQEKELSS